MDEQIDPYYEIDLSKIKKSYDLWRQYLPEVDLYYAMKCNPNEIILKDNHRHEALTEILRLLNESY